MELGIIHTELETNLKSRISDVRFAALQSIKKTDIPLIAYTSFDGDMLSHSELMKQYIHKKGLVPLNPESALGTYLVVNHYGGDKNPIIEDCLSLINIVDHFYVMTKQIHKASNDIREQPEGVIAELLYWVSNKQRNVTYVDISSYTLEKEIAYKDGLLGKLDEQQRAGIKNVLAINRGLRPAVYLLSGEEHAKHSDWMRKDAYVNTRVPLCPYTLISFSTLQSAYPGDYVRQLCCRVAIGMKANEIFIYGIDTIDSFQVSNLPEDALAELYVILKLSPEKKVYYKFFGEIGVPKYVNRKKWAVTQHEQETGTGI